MINKIFFQSSDSQIALDIINIIEKFTSIPKVSFEIYDSITENKETNQIFIFLCSTDKEVESVLSDLEIQNAAYICSVANKNILSKFKTITGVGLQRHLDNNYEFSKEIFLGTLKNNTKTAEPIIRDAELMIFDLNVLRRSEVAMHEFSGVSGINSEEASQMFRYAGMSEKNKYILINNAIKPLTGLISQLIWYFAESATARFPDHPYFKESVHEYIVDMKTLDKSISFYKSKASGRWWVKVPNTEENKWRACNYQDYQKACEDEISPQLLEIISVS